MGGEKKTKEMGRAQKDETLWDTDKRETVTLAAPSRTLFYQATLVIKGIGQVGGTKKAKRWGGRARRDAVGC